MSKPLEVDVGHWNQLVRICEGESDRGAAVLAGSFIEHILGNYLRARSTIAKTLDELLSPMGFRQRIMIAYAFGFINKKYYDDLNIIREIRNEFAHHPVDRTFESEEIATLVAKLSTFGMAGRSDPRTPRERNRLAYLFICAMFSAAADEHIRKKRKSVDSSNPPTNSSS